MTRKKWLGIGGPPPYSFFLLPLTGGRLSLACLVSLGLCLNKLLSCLLAGIEVLGDIAQHLFGMLFRSVLCGVHIERNNRIFEGEECFIIELKQIFLLSLFEWPCHTLYFGFPRFMQFWVDFCFPCTLPVFQGICFCCTFILFFNKIFYYW